MTRLERQQLKRYKQMRLLIKRWTQYEILARLAPIGFPDYADYYKLMLDTRDEIRKLMFKSDDLVFLGVTWGILSEDPKGPSRRSDPKGKRHRVKKTRNKKFRKA